MKKFSIILIILLLFISCMTTGSKDFFQMDVYNRLPNNTAYLKFIEYNNGFFIIDQQTQKYYRLDGQTMIGYITILYKEYGQRGYEETSLTSDFIRAGNTPVKWEVQIITDDTISDSINESALRQFTNDRRQAFALVNDGQGIIRVVLNEIEIDIDFMIETLPFKIHTKYDDLIQLIGYPDEEDKRIGDSWETSSPNLKSRFVHTWNLYYDKYPNLQIRINQKGEVERIVNSRQKI